MIPDGFPGADLEAFAEGFATGLVGTLGVTIDDGDGNNIVARTTASIAQIQTVGALGVYRYLGVRPNLAGTYLITWDDGVISASEEFTVTFDAPVASPGPSLGPCDDWCSGAEIADECGADYDSETSDAFDDAATQSSGILWAISGRLYSGLCGPLTVRPNSDACHCFGRTLPDAYGWDGWSWGLGWACCSGTDKVLLSGYPVVAIAQVKIDGDLIAPSSYRLDEYQYLTRLADTDGNRQRWPTCQRYDKPDDEQGTFAVTYWYGTGPPPAGVQAAVELGCELYRARPDTAGECRLPKGAKRIVRQGITIETVSSIAAMLRQGATGVAGVDAFMAAYGNVPDRRPAVWSPTGPKYARAVGNQ